MYYLALSLFAILAMQSWQMGDGVCCEDTFILFSVKEKEVCRNYHNSSALFWTNTCFNRLCGDLSSSKFCCGVGSCNFFCCNCDDGCIAGNPVKLLLKEYGKNITILSETPEDLKKENTTKSLTNSTTISVPGNSSAQIIINIEP
ncbi:hypothetical protein KR044_007479 [Drosophila immigrans]|nr:hypothetical protein KR044_007479 [Drosophila immigrans]